MGMKLFPEPPRSDLASIALRASERTEQRTLDQRKNVRRIVWEFAQTRQRIVYGGAALNALLDNYADADAADMDIEFYSPEPGRDVVELCDLLHSTPGMEFVQGREAVHVGTLTVSVEFHRCCDITFMPRRTALSMPTLVARGVRCIHPHVMAMDLLRMLTEPDTSYWRLERAYARIRLLEEHYPLSWDEVADVTPDQTARELIPELLCGSAVIVGAHAACFFEGATEPQTTLQVVCACYDHDVGVVRKAFDGSLREVRLDAFGDLLGRSTRFLDAGGSCVVEVIDAHPRCIPCSPAPGLMVASSLFCLVTAMACHLRAFVTGDRVTLAQQSLICTRLLRARQEPSVACEDFGIDHVVGGTESDMRLHMHSKSRTRGRTQSWLRYSPASSQGDAQRRRMWLMTFPARTGRVILNGTRMSVQHNS